MMRRRNDSLYGGSQLAKVTGGLSLLCLLPACSMISAGEGIGFAIWLAASGGLLYASYRLSGFGRPTR